jgi:2-haloacid dehalogenase
VERWATFDCYGTLVDWNSGIRGQLDRLFGTEPAGELLARYHELEPGIQSAHPSASYREVLTLALEQLAEDEGLAVPEGEGGALARSLATWPVFPEVHGALTETRAQGWRLAILSNTDRDLIDASMTSIGVPFDLAIVASEIGSYKPAPRHWEVFFEESGADRSYHVHVAASLFHDIAPCSGLGLTTVWVNRLGEIARAAPTREVADLAGLPDVLDELVPG